MTSVKPRKFPIDRLQRVRNPPNHLRTFKQSFSILIGQDRAHQRATDQRPDPVRRRP
ncbi:hypothetical protein MASSI9I_90173 [Massilia sp. 9I]|nr:hypothetical protein MASSI9I_90173 [Massilia sp. 9I]